MALKALSRNYLLQAHYLMNDFKSLQAMRALLTHSE